MKKPDIATPQNSPYGHDFEYRQKGADQQKEVVYYWRRKLFGGNRQRCLPAI